uniref:Pyroglutamylated RFamide peptide n=1 Tax=Jaculus jaculus TaxID=51337 RepID=A0A8C5JY28_JACJA
MRSLPYLLLLPWGACFPLLDGRGPEDGTESRMGWPQLAEGRRPHSAWGPQTPALLMVAKELEASRREQAGFRLERQEGGQATAFLPGGGEKASGPLGSLAEELSSYSRKKGGFRFRFGR